MKYIDIHAHINFPQYEENRHEVALRAFENEVGMINVGTGLETSKEVVALTEKYEFMKAAIGLHPLYVTGDDDEGENEEVFDYEAYKALAEHENVVAIGECGLDFSRLSGDDEEQLRQKKAQSDAFRAQIRLAKEVGKPLIIHSRDRYAETLAIIAEEDPESEVKVDFHFFAGTLDDLKEILDRGYYVSFTGVITFAEMYHELIKATPMDRIMAETDCPYVTPVPHRGKTNEPSFVIEVYKKIAELKGLENEEARGQLMKNALNFFDIEQG